ncbi:MAG: hypothetical protein NT161_02825 [Candidatus Nomurabacteria bacterium]|nr:hypothetical protein [Candidatus Nomurabacteria bacterium]
MEIKRVGIIRGGVGDRHAISVRRGGDLISHIFENLSDKYKVIDIFIDKNGNWHANGLPIVPTDLMRKVDIVWDTSRHSSLSTTLDDLSISSIGSSSFLKSLENNREMLKTHMKSIGIKMPRFIISPKNAQEVFEKFGSPWVVKINNEIKLVKIFNELAEIIKDKSDVIVEEFITGKPSTVHSISGFRGEDIYVLLPQNFTADEKEKIVAFAKGLHKHLATEHYLKSDFVLHPKRGFFLTNIDFSPDIREGSHFQQSCEFVGARMQHIIEHILNKALEKRI